MKKDHLEQLSELLKNSPNDTFLIYAIAMKYVKQGKSKQALDYFKKLMGIDPNYTATYYHLGQLYESMGQIQNAINTYKTGMDITKQSGEDHAFNELNTALLMLSDKSNE